MEIKKFFESKIAKAGLVLGLGALVLGACGEGQKDSVTHNNPQESHIEAEYLENGNRLLKYKDDEAQYADILQVCDGRDLLEQTEYFYRSGDSIERSVGHPACADGRLTESDFTIAK